MNTAPSIPLAHLDTTAREAQVDFGTGTHPVRTSVTTAMGCVMVLANRIEIRLNYLANMGTAVRGVTITEARTAAAEIRGLIEAVTNLTDTPSAAFGTWRKQLHDDLRDTLATTEARLRRKA